MFTGIDLYGQEVAGLKKMESLAGELAERLQLPEEALLSAAKLTVVAGRRLVVENHRGILEYGPERIVVSAGRAKLCINGAQLSLEAMNKTELLIVGRIQSVEWE